MTWSNQGNVPGLCGTLRGGNCSIVLLYCPQTTLTGMQKGRQGTASDTFRNSHTNTGIPAKFFSLCCLRLGGVLDTNKLLRMPQILFLTLDYHYHTHLMFIHQSFIKCMGFYFVYMNMIKSVHLVTLYAFVEITKPGL